MDEALVEAVHMLEPDRDSLPLWREILYRSFHEARVGASDDWDRFAELFAAYAYQANLSTEAAQRFLDYGRQTYGMDLVEQAVNLTDDQMQQMHEYRLHAAWQRLVAEHGAEWADCDGTDAHWQYFRDRFYAHAHALDPQLYGLVHGWLTPYDTAPPAERHYALRALGLPVSDFAVPETRSAGGGHGEKSHPYASFDRMSVDDIERIILAYA
ncbi:hypothetical protein AB0D30_31345 [Streptomyces sp. NPDC048409]|uniref:hypothetical protein n=1 Tax=Streptomyces sp. NPDC048409 TaxID=3154723 RepID=UPI003446CA54